MRRFTTKLSPENLWVKRPGIGEISAEQLEQLFGKIAGRDISADEHLSWNDLSY